MGFLDGLKGNWTPTEVSQVANHAESWFFMAEGLQSSADALDALVRAPLLSYASNQNPETMLAAIVAEQKVPSMTLLYGFALENAFKSAIVSDDPDFDYAGTDPSGTPYSKRVFSHNLVALYDRIDKPVALEVAERQFLDDLSIVVIAQGRYPIGKPKPGSRNTVVSYDPTTKDFVAKIMRSTRDYLKRPTRRPPKSPPAGVVDFTTNPPPEVEGFVPILRQLGLHIFDVDA